MPKSTFYRISQEKQKRIVDVARQQFLSVPYRDVSINKIIKEAEIPRGSFYQYFDDKEDLFRFVLKDMKSNMFHIIMEEMEKYKGDIFLCLESNIDRIVEFIYHDNSGKMQMLFSESWILETMVMAVFKEERCDGEQVFRIIDKIDRSSLDIEDEKELIIMVSIISAVVRDSIGKIFLDSGQNEEEAKKMFKAKIRSLKRHYRQRD